MSVLVGKQLPRRLFTGVDSLWFFDCWNYSGRLYQALYFVVFSMTVVSERSTGSPSRYWQSVSEMENTS